MRTMIIAVIATAVSGLLILSVKAQKAETPIVVPAVVRDVYKEALAAKDKKEPLSIVLVVPKDCKILINEKPVSYEKFEILMEFASSSFTPEDLVFRGGILSAMRLKSKE